jgi:hypothetical protein
MDWRNGNIINARKMPTTHIHLRRYQGLRVTLFPLIAILLFHRKPQASDFGKAL